MSDTDAKSPVIYTVASAGHPNYGSELITAGWLRHLARTAPEAEVWLDTPRPGQSAVLFDGLHPGLRCVDTLFHACWNAPTTGVTETMDFGERVVNDPGLIPREATGVENLSRVDLVHIQGGGYINGIWPQHTALLGAARGIAGRYGARTALTGAGLAPFAGGDTGALSATLADFDVVDLRDEPSHGAVVDAVPHAMMTGDDALLSLGGDPIFGAEGAQRTMLSLQADMLEVPLDQLADYVVRTLRAWGVDQDPITLIECNPPEDTAVMSLLQPHLPQITVLPFSHLWRSGFPAGPGQRWITTRLHTHLVAAAAGAWGVAVPVSSDYYRTKHAALVRAGSGWSVADDLSEPAPAGDAPDAPFKGRLSAMVSTKRRVADRVAMLAKPARPSP